MIALAVAAASSALALRALALSALAHDRWARDEKCSPSASKKLLQQRWRCAARVMCRMSCATTLARV